MVSRVMGRLLDQITNGGKPVIKKTLWHIALDGGMSSDVADRIIQCQKYIDEHETDGYMAFSLQYAFDFIEHCALSGTFELKAALTPFGFDWNTEMYWGIIMLVPSIGGWVTNVLPRRL